VGTDRKPIAVRTKNYTFVAPMNGLLDLVLEEEKPLEVVEITNKRYTLKAINNTFHGRDLFTPAAAHLSRGVPLRELGKPIRYRRLLNFPKPRRFKGGVEGEIVYFDRFGNAVTNIPCGRFRFCTFRNLRGGYVKAFLYGEKNKPNFTCGSFGFVEVFAPQGSFRELFNPKRGERVRCYY
jgi:S-adenosylmethionine hydrolase